MMIPGYKTAKWYKRTINETSNMIEWAAVGIEIPVRYKGEKKLWQQNNRMAKPNYQTEIIIDMGSGMELDLAEQDLILVDNKTYSISDVNIIQSKTNAAKTIKTITGVR